MQQNALAEQQEAGETQLVGQAQQVVHRRQVGHEQSSSRWANRRCQRRCTSNRRAWVMQRRVMGFTTSGTGRAGAHAHHVGPQTLITQTLLPHNSPARGNIHIPVHRTGRQAMSPIMAGSTHPVSPT